MNIYPCLFVAFFLQVLLSVRLVLLEK